MSAIQPLSNSISLTVNGEYVEHAPCSIAQLLQDRQLTGKRLAVERNGSIVPKSQHATTFIQPDDRLEIVVAVGGG